MRILKALAAAAVLLVLPVAAHAADAAALAKAFGARPKAWGVQLSPDGARIVYLTPVGTLGTAIVVADIASGATKVVLGTQNNAVRPAWCQWKSDKRLICMLSGVSNAVEDKLDFTRIMAIDADGSNPKTLGSRSNSRTRTIIQTSGNVIDWLPDDPDHVLMQVELAEGHHRHTPRQCRPWYQRPARQRPYRAPGNGRGRQDQCRQLRYR